jgi:hypothetical protein
MAPAVVVDWVREYRAPKTPGAQKRSARNKGARNRPKMKLKSYFLLPSALN